jgi:hypothetical protein
MIKVKFLRNQIVESRIFINKLIKELPEDLWYKIPENTDSNFAWQIGHLIISQNFHAISVITGENHKVLEIVPISQYEKLFKGNGTKHRSLKKDLIPTSLLKQQLDAVHEICIENLSTLRDDILEDDIEPAGGKHPIANTKYEALSWCFKHEIWHGSEMEDIKKALDYPKVWRIA